MPKIMGK